MAASKHANSEMRISYEIIKIPALLPDLVNHVPLLKIKLVHRHKDTSLLIFRRASFTY